MKKIKGPLEKEIQRSILEYLKLRGHYCFRNNTGAFSIPQQGLFKRRFIRFGEVGSPDIVGCLKGKGLFFGIEVKSEKGQLTDNQKEIQATILSLGGRYIVARSVDDVIKEGF